MIQYIHSSDCSQQEILQYLHQISFIEKNTYGFSSYRNEEFLYSLYQKNPFSFFFAIEKSQIIAYVDIWSLNFQLYYDLLFEKTLEENFSIFDLAPLDNPFQPFWYIGSFIVLEKYQNSMVYNYLAYILWNYLYQKNYLFPIHIFGVASSPQGALMMEKWKFKNLHTTTSKPRYERIFFHVSELLELKNKYQQKIISC